MAVVGEGTKDMEEVNGEDREGMGGGESGGFDEEGSATINSHKMQIKQVTPNPRDLEQGGGGGSRRNGEGWI